MAAGLGASGYLALTFETTPGTFLPPTTAGTVFVPIISEALEYSEDKYYSEAIRQQTIANDAKNSYYHAEGDIVWEVDTKFLPYFLYISRMTPAKTGAGPYVYTFTPNATASAPLPGDTVTGITNRRTASITVVRNNIGFCYAGCTVGSWAFTIENGVLRATMSMMGLSEQDPGANGSPSWSAPALLGADCHQVFVAAAGTAPTYGANSTDFNGFTFTVNDNPTPQNRIRADRSASYISYGMTELTIDTELDFVSKTEYTNFRTVVKRAVKLESVQGAPTTTYATATDNAVSLQAFNTVYDTYPVGLGSAGDLIMASTSMRGLAIAGGTAYAIGVKSSASIL